MHLCDHICLPNHSSGTFKSGLGGNWISDQIRLLFSQSQPPVPLTPHYLIASKRPVDAGAAAQATMRSFAISPHASFRRLQEERVLTEFKESCVQIWNAAAYGGTNLSANIDTAKNLPGRAFEMPDGWSNVFGIDRYRAAEGLFDETAAVTVSRSWRHICAKALTHSGWHTNSTHKSRDDTRHGASCPERCRR